MQTIQLTSHGVELTPAQERLIRGEIARLERLGDGAVSCRVTVDAPNHWASGAPMTYAFRIVLAVPGHEVVVSRQAREDFRLALEEAFDTARRRLKEFADRRHEVARAADRLRDGWIARLLAYEGYGFIATAAGEEIYFHRNAVGGVGFDRLREGDDVRFAEEPGADGPQASVVTPLAD